MHFRILCALSFAILYALPRPAAAQVSPLGSTFVLWNAAARGSAVAFDTKNRVYFTVSAHGWLYGRFTSEDGAPLGDAFIINSGGFAQFPHVAYSPDANNGNGGFLVTWHNAGVWGVMVGYGSGLLSPEVFLSGADTVYEIMGAPIAYSTVSKEFFVVWRIYASLDIQGIRVSNTGAALSGVIPINDPGYVQLRSNPSIAYNPASNEYLVGYAAGLNNARNVTVQRVKPGSGQVLTGPTVVAESAAIYTTSVAYNSKIGGYLVAWHQIPPDAIYARIVTSSGSPSGDIIPLSTRYGTYDSLSLSHNAVSGTVLMVGQDKLGFEDGGVEVAGSIPSPGFQVTFNAGQPWDPNGTNGNFHPRAASHSARKEWMVVAANGFTRTIAQRLTTVTSGGPAPVQPLTASVAANVVFPVPQGVPITWTATASGGTAPHQYKFLRVSGSGSWLVAQDWSSANTYTWYPTAGTHAVQVWVRNAGSSTAFDAYTGTGYFTVTAPAAKLLSFTADRTFPALYGTPITWTATATGGTLPVEYKFLRYSTSTGWIVAREYSSINTYTWFPPMGTNAIQVWVRTVGSLAGYQDHGGSGLFQVSSTPASAKLSGISANVTFPASPQASITWTATATGGNGPLEYRFVQYNATTNTWSVIRDWGSNQVVQGPAGVTGTGRHLVQVWVRTVGSGVAYEDWRNTDYFLITDITSVTLTSNLPLATLSAGQPVTFTASVTGGSGPWDFAWFTYDGVTWTRNVTYAANANIFTTAFPAGTKVVQVWVRQSGSATAWEAWQSTGAFVVR